MIKDKVVTQFPALVQVTSPIILTKIGNSYTLGFDKSQAPAGPQGPAGSAGATGATGAAGGVITLNGQTGTLALFVAPQGRITLTSGASVMTTSVAAATTVYYTLAGGNQVPIYDGTNFVPSTFAELSQATTDTTKSPAAVVNNSNYDLFAWNDSGTIRCTRGPPWTSDTARGSGAGTTELQIVSGIYLNKNAITNGPAANRGTYVGSIRSNGTATIDWILGNLASGGGAASLFVWNAYNQNEVRTVVADTTSSWAYTSTTIRQVRAQTTMKISFLSGLPSGFIDAAYACTIIVAAVNGAFSDVGIALDSITVYDKKAEGSGTASTALTHPLNVGNCYGPQLGMHYIAALENGDGTNSSTFTGGNNQSLRFTMLM